MLELFGVDFSRHGKTVLNEVSCTVKAGELLGVLGANGAGKSTLLQMMAGLLPPAAGRVELEGQPLQHTLFLPRILAFLDADGTIEWDMPVEAVVALGRKARGSANRQEDAIAVEQALYAVDGVHLRHRAAASLSTGEKARVLLARTIAQETPVLLLDEPVASLDPSHQLSVMDMLRNRAERGAAVVAVLHDVTLAARFCHRIILLHQGEIVAEGEPSHVLATPAAEKALEVVFTSLEKDGERFIIPHKTRK